MSEEEVNAGLREEAAERRAQSAHARRDARPVAHDLARAAAPDASSTRSRSSPAAACTAIRDLRGTRAARRARRAPRRRPGAGGRSATAPPSCSARATRALIEPGDELLTPLAVVPAVSRSWRAARTAGPCRCPGGVDALLAGGSRAATRARSRSRSPNDPTGELLGDRRARAAARGAARAASSVLLDEALVDFVDAQPSNASLAAAGRAPAAARVPQLLQGLGPGRACASATRSAGPARRSCSPSCEPDLGVSRGLPGRRAGGAAQLLGASSRRRVRDDQRASAPRVTAALRERGLRRHRRARPTSCGPPIRPSTAASWPRAWPAPASSSPPAPPSASRHHVRIAPARLAPLPSACCGAIDKVL